MNGLVDSVNGVPYECFSDLDMVNYVGRYELLDHSIEAVKADLFFGFIVIGDLKE